MEKASSADEAGRHRVGFEGDGNQLGLDADLHDKIGGHQVDLVVVAAADQVQTGRQRPEHTAPVTVEVGVGRSGAGSARVAGSGAPSAHPKMLPGELSVVVVVGTLPVMAGCAREPA